MAVSRTRRSLSTSIKVGERKPVKTIPTKTLIRSMQQINAASGTPLHYEFHFGISTFTHDSSGVVYTEIPRPLNIPLVDATAQKLERCSFEFLIAVPYDSLGTSVDSHITLLQDFANEARPVQFSNVHSALGSRTWNIDSITFQITRVNESGQATAVTCNMSLVESIARTERFIRLPKFTYTIPKGTKKSDSPGTDSPGDGNGVTGTILSIYGAGSGVVVATTAGNHGLKSGSFVKLLFDTTLSPAIMALNAGGNPVAIVVDPLTLNKFTYTSVGGGFVSQTSVIGKASYTVTKAVAKQYVFLPPVPNVNLNLSSYTPSTTTQKTDRVVQLDATILENNALIETIVKPYLYSLQAGRYTKGLYAKNIGDTSSASFKAAVTYLVKMHAQGRLPQDIGLPEIILNAGL